MVRVVSRRELLMEQIYEHFNHQRVVSGVVGDAKANPFAATLPPTADGPAMGGFGW